jgi:hypothetical protein
MMMELFDFLVVAVVVWGIVRVISRWLKTKEGITQRRLQELEQRLHRLEIQQVQELQKRISILEEIFVTEDVTLQRKLRQALSGDALGTSSQPPLRKPPEHP